MLKKRGQLTIFIILAILIVAIIALFFAFRGKIGIGKEERIPSDVAPIKNFVEECVDESLEKVIFRIGENGGYYSSGQASSVPVLEIPYYIKENRSLMPTKEKVQDEISKGVSRELALCLGDFALFPEYEITKGKMKITAKIEQEEVFADVKYPLIIQKEESKLKIEDFSSKVPVRFGIVYDAIAEFENSELLIGGRCASCLLGILIERDLYANSFDYNDETKIFIFRDSNSKINEKEFVFNFANEY